MANKGTAPSVKRDINQIKRLLQDQYPWDKSGLTLLKELVQNANDAKATVLRLGVIDGANCTSANPLLSCPALVVVNNSPFSKSDAARIRDLGVSSKDKDHTAVGKFGLGLKSVFHLCEAFFYLSSDENQSGQPETRNVYNPHSPPAGSYQEENYPDWDIFEDEEHQWVINRLTPMLADLNPWFVVWVPLRDPRLLKQAAILKRSPIDYSRLKRLLVSDGVDVKMARLLPMLDKLQLIELWSGTEKITQMWQAGVSDASARRKTLKASDEFPVAARRSHYVGEINVGPEKFTKRLAYCVAETVSTDRSLRQIWHDDQWPEDYEGQRERAWPHAAVSVVSNPAANEGKGRVNIQWAVFLPLSESSRTSEEIDGLNHDVTILLHGYFFVDAGRNRAAIKETGNPIRGQWNLELEQRGIWPLLIPALDSFLKKENWSFESAETLIGGLTKLFEDGEKRLAAVEDLLIPVVQTSPGKSLEVSYNCVVAGTPFYRLPSPVKKSGIEKLIPGLLNVSSSRILKAEGHAQISNESPEVWAEEDIDVALTKADFKRITQNDDDLHYTLNCLLVMLTEQHTPPRSLLNAIKMVIVEMTSEQLSKHSESIKRFFEPSHLREFQTVPWYSGNEELFRRVARQFDRIVLVPEIARSFQGRARLNQDEVERVFTELERDKNTTNANDVVEWVRANAEQADKDVLDQNSSFKVFPLVKASGSTVTASWREVEEALAAGCLFSEKGKSNELQRALAKSQTLYFTEHSSRQLCGREIPKCDFIGCIRAISSTGNDLGKPNRRVDLVNALLTEQRSSYMEDQIRALRFLLHGRVEHRDSMRTLFFITDGGTSNTTAAKKLMEFALTASRRSFRLLPNPISEWISQHLYCCEKLNLKELSVEAAVRELSRLSAEQLESLTISKPSYHAILETVPDSDEEWLEIIRKLPIHPIVAGDNEIRVSIDSHCYWASKLELPNIISDRMTLLALDSNPKIRNIQQKLTEEVDHKNVLDQLLSVPKVSDQISYITASLSQLDKLTEKLTEKLKSVRWVPTTHGPRKLSATIPIDRIDNEVSRISRQFDYEFVAWSSVASSADPTVPKKLRKQLEKHNLLKDESKYLAQLGDKLASSNNSSGCESEFHIGQVDRTQFAYWLTVDWPAEIMPSHELLKAVVGDGDSHDCFDQIGNTLSLPIRDPLRLEGILKHLQTRWNTRGEGQADARQLYRMYLHDRLRCFDETVESVQWLRKTQLPSATGEWKKSVELIRRTEGFSDSHTIALELEELLTNWLNLKGLAKTLHSDSIADADQDIQPNMQPVAVASEYFSSWEGRVPHGHIGGFLALLGDDPAVMRLSQRFLGKRQLEETRRNFLITSIMGKHQFKTADQRCHIEVADGANADANNLFGDRIQVPLQEDADTILVGNNGKIVEVDTNSQKQRVLSLKLRRVRENLDAAERSERLENAAVSVLLDGYSFSRDKEETFRERFRSLAQDDQLEVSIAQQMIIDSAILVLGQLKCQPTPSLDDVIHSLTDGQRLIAERRHNERTTNRPFSRLDEENKQFYELQDELQRLLNDVNSVQDTVLSAVRKQIRDQQQYDVDSIPFELFQNADDAYEDRVKLFAPLDADAKFSLFAESGSLAICHFGRCINQVPPDVDHPRKHRMADDLLKMLVLWLSNKSDNNSEQLNSTGKFGLGFKSVHLVTDRPRIRSGSLAFEIVGGIFPRYMNMEEQELLDKYNSDGDWKHGTVIELPYAPESTPSTRRFLRMGHFLTVFANHVRKISVNDETAAKSEVRETHWKPRTSLPGWESGILTPLSSESKPLAAVVAVTEDRSAILFSHDGKQITRIADDIPSIWVTAPTKEHFNLGFVLNAQFAVDTGRARVAGRTPHNDELTERLAKQFGKLLIRLAEQPWEQTIKTLDLDDSAEEYEFWYSLWLRVGCDLSGRDPADESAEILIHRLLWHPEFGAMTSLVRNASVIPNGLSGDAQRLISGEHFRGQAKFYGLTGSILSSQKIRERCFNLKGINGRSFGPRSCLDEKNVGDPLRKFASQLVEGRIETLSLAKVLGWLSENGEAIEPRDFELIVEILKDEIFANADAIIGNEKRPINEALRKLKFLNASGLVSSASNLLVDTGIKYDEEAMLYAFAPATNKLHSGYVEIDPESTYFRRCRNARSTDIKQIASWCLSASSELRNAVLVYIANSTRKDELIPALRDCAGFFGSWIESALNQQPELSESREQRTRRIIESGYENEDFDEPEFDLVDFYDWWQEHGNAVRVEKYALILPEDECKHIHHKFEGNEEQRVAWMKLFLLAMCHTVGLKPQQHSGFLRFCDRKGWINRFIQRDGDRGRWVEILDEYFGTRDNREYLHWMQLYVKIFAVAERLEEYVRSFLSVQKQRQRFPKNAFTEPYTWFDNPSGAPSIRRALGLGASFVFRELLRLEVVTNELAHEHAFAASKPVRELFDMHFNVDFRDSDRDAWSIAIWEKLQLELPDRDPTFGGDFDIPLQFAARHPYDYGEQV